MRILLARRLRSAAYALVSFGQIWVYIPPTAEPDDVPAAGPCPGHPERLCPEVPLSEAEMTWGRQLLGVPGADSCDG
ncbi:DUF6059 family protein [Streptomyces sp. NPDC058221]|uniref:DUF6059 family protein n=1 Tax=Streptomyces sp. NPDC058221 TaxID=3346388 RepID=UPI0036EC23A2